MKKFNQLLHEPLTWKNDDIWGRTYTLRHGDTVLAHLEQDQGLFKSDASIYVPDEEKALYIFRPKGILNRRLEVESSDIDFVPAKLIPHTWSDGVTIHFSSGNQYEWNKTDFWGRTWQLTTAEGVTIATQKLGTWSNKGIFTILSDAPAPAELTQLIFAGWVEMILELQAAAA